MSYQVIARKWRPQTFTELVGQSHIAQTLFNALSSHRLAHALLFTGPRGTGKTSTARILAKSLRCPNAKDFVPCNECDSCQEIAQGRSVDVIEIDGASNNGVDAVRELRDSVGFMPSSGKYKVYIIDEVHMLSTSAFNALLKTLEEPPEHVIFIMATTEAHKIPQTILSRCQRFDFRRISTKLITDHLNKICEQENFKAEPEALWLVARLGDGSMRDSQSILEQVATFTNKQLTYARVVEVLGLTDRSLVLEALSAILERDPQKSLNVIEKFLQTSTEPHLFAQDLLEMIRNLTIVKVSGDASRMILDLPDSEIQTLQSWAQSTTSEELQMLFDMALKGISDIVKAHDTRIVLEMVILRLASAPTLVSIQELLKSAGAPNSIPTAKTPSRPPIARPATQGSTSTSSAPMVPATPPKAESHFKLQPNLTAEENWLRFVSEAKLKDSLLGSKVENIQFLGMTEKRLNLGVPAKMQFLKQQLASPETGKKLQSMIDQFYGPGYAFDIQLTKDRDAGISAHALTELRQQNEKEQEKIEISEHPLVKTAQAVFKGQIKSIKETP